MPCTELILNNATGEKLLFFSKDPILARITSANFADTSAMWLNLWVKKVDNVSLNFSEFAQTKAGFTKITGDNGLHQNNRGVNNFIFDLSGILKSYTKTLMPSNDFIGTGGDMIAFYYEYGRYNNSNVKQAEQGESNVMYVYRGVSRVLYQYLNTIDYTLKQTIPINTIKKFLTYNTNFWDPNLPAEANNSPKRLTTKQKDYLYFVFAASDCEPSTSDEILFVLDYKLKNGNAFQIIKFDNVTSGVKYMQVGIEKVKEYFAVPVMVDTIDSYKITLFQPDQSDLAYGATYKLVDEDCDETVTLLFENRLGGMETVVFRGQIDTTIERTYQEYERSFDYDNNYPITKTLEASIRPKQKLNSGWLRLHEFNWLKDLMTAVNVYAMQEDGNYAVNIKQVNYIKSSKDDLYMVEIEIAYQKEGYLTN